MWQRSQTLYIAIATALLAAMFFCTKASYVNELGEPVSFSYVSYWPYLVLLILVTGLNLLALFTFKIRVFQLRTTLLSAILTVALQGWIVVDFFASQADGFVFGISAVFPIVACVFDILAIRGIWADELIVRNASRLRAAKRKR